MAIFKCKMCGGSLEVAENATVCECEYCGTQQTLPKMDNAQTLNMLGRANHFRQQCEFDKALEIYERALSTNDSDPELYWSLVLCRYGIEYVDDPLTDKKIPTCHRTQFKSILEDADYLSALENADSFQAELYKKEAEYIDSVQKGILEISNKEEPFDIFICYKESDENGNRTQDSVLAQDLYYQLTQEGFKVFFSRITLEDKLGSAYEPYIFAALNSAKVMVVVGTKPEYFNAVWVKNEWSRYLQIMQNDHNKVIIPAYKNMDPYDLPDALSMFQAQDMSKLGFMQDLLRGIKKIASTNSAKTESVSEIAVQTENSKIAPLLKRIRLFLEDGDWDNATEYCNKILDIDPECSQAYYCILMSKLNIHTNEEFEKSVFPDGISNDDYYKKAVRFANDEEKKRLNNLNCQTIYNFAEDRLKNTNNDKGYREIAKIYASISGFKDSSEKAEQCNHNALQYLYDLAERKLKNALTDIDYREIAKIYTSISGFKDSSEKAKQCENNALQYLYNQAEKAMKNAREGEDYLEAEKKFESISDFQDSAEKVQICRQKAEDSFRDEKYERAFGILHDEYAREESLRKAQETFKELSDWKNSDKLIEECEKRIVEIQKAKEISIKKAKIKRISIISAIVCAVCITVGAFSIKRKNDLNEKARIVAEEKARIAEEERKRTEMFMSFQEKSKYISCGSSHTVGLKSDGTVVATGDNFAGQCDVSNWKDIVAVSAGGIHTVGLKSDGTVVATGDNEYGQCDISDWKDIVAVSAGGHTVGLKSDGTVVATGINEDGQCDVSDWKDIVAVSAGGIYTVGLKADGTVVATGDNEYGQCDISDWSDIIAVSAWGIHTVGLKADGTVVATGDNEEGQCNVSDWSDIIAVSAGAIYTVGLKSDGTVVATDIAQNIFFDDMGQCDVSDWKDIVAVSAGIDYTVGLKSDGTVVATGDNEEGQCDVSDWTDIGPMEKTKAEEDTIEVEENTTKAEEDATKVEENATKAEEDATKAEEDATKAEEKKTSVVSNGNLWLVAKLKHTVGLKSDGTVIAAGDNMSGECNVSGWKDIVAVSAGASHTVGLKSDGTVVAAGENMSGKCDVSGWKDIVAISAGNLHTVGLKSDGTVVATGDSYSGACDVSDWKDIVAISAGNCQTIGLKSDGTVVATAIEGMGDYGQCDVSDWKDIVAISAGDGHTVGLKSDGTVIAIGFNGGGQCDVSGWSDIIAISAGNGQTVGLKSDGTVVAAGSDYGGQCDVSGWSDIIAVSAGDGYTVGLKSDGTVVETGIGYGEFGQCDVSNWTNIGPMKKN